MRGIILAKLTTFIRNPGVFLLFTAMSIGFAFIIGNTGGDMDRIAVPIYSEDQIEESSIGKALEESEVYRFYWVEEAELNKQISKGNVEAGLIVNEKGFELIVGIDSPNVQLIEQTVSEIYQDYLRLENLILITEATTEAEKESIQKEFEQAMAEPIFEIRNQSFRSSDAFIYDNSLHTIFGFSLFFVIYTVAYNVLPILIEKKEGIWDRMILSPLKKSEMYIANLIYSFFEGYLQILIIFSVFHFFFGIDFNGKFIEVLLIMIPYIFTIVALSVFLTAVVKNTNQFNAVLPIMSVSMAMIGGAFWPIEIVQSEFLLALAKLNPLTYGMEALNGLVIYNYSFEELLLPISILLLMGVVLIGIGIHLMERRHL